MRPQLDKPPADRRIVALAGRHRVVSRRALLAAGVTPDTIKHRLATGMLRRVHRGVYAVGELSPRGRALAAVLRAGPEAALSHHSAAALLGIRPEWHGPIHVSAPSKHEIRGAVVHRTTVHPNDRTIKDAIPTTSPRRTLLDLAEVLPEPALQKAINEAEILHLTTRPQLHTYATRHNGRRGAKRLRTATAAPPSPTRSHLEDLFLALIESFDLPRPLINTQIEHLEVDFAWPDQRLIVEVDGAATHTTQHGFERDRHRDLRLKLAGWEVVRFSYRSITRERETVAAALRALLYRAA